MKNGIIMHCYTFWEFVRSNTKFTTLMSKKTIDLNNKIDDHLVQKLKFMKSFFVDGRILVISID